MSDTTNSNGAREGKNGSGRVAAAAVTLAVAQARDRRARASAEYETQTKDLNFTKDFNSALEATMRDRLNTQGERYLAWLKRNAWGEYSLYAIGPDGHPKTQQDAANELGIQKGVISRLAIYYEERGYLRREGKKQYPVIAPQFGPPPGKVTRSHDKLTFREFVEAWKVTHSSDFSELEVARSTIEKIRKVMLADYKKLREQATKASDTLLEIARDQPGDTASSKSLTPFEEDQRRKRRPEQTQPENVPADGEMQSKAREFLFSEIARMQAAYPNTNFSKPPISPETPEHQRLVSLILKKLCAIDEENLVGYVTWVAAEFRGLGINVNSVDGSRTSRKRAPGTKGGAESLGLLVNFAEDYARVAGKILEPSRCSNCGRPLDGGSVNGACFDCAMKFSSDATGEPEQQKEGEL